MKYSGLITALDEDYTGIGVSQFLSDNFVNMSMVTNTTPVIQELDYTGLAGFKYKFITGKDITISENMAGIVLATGNVTVANGVNFRGMIIARGVVQVQGGNLTAEPEEVSELITNNSIVAPYFKIGGDGSSGSSTGNILSSELLNIKYENWSKN